MRATRSKAKLVTAVVTPLLAASAALAVTAPQASAATTGTTGADACTHPSWSNKSGGEGTAKGTSATVRTGPNKDCPVTATVGTAVTLYYHCWVTNSAGNKWTHVRISGTQINGWVYNPSLDDGGSTDPSNRC
ncbi:SH3 domain-containing protein [Streptomyces sp. NPDC021093]|uniref:SH3 domain-containing protein n=1 Tax=Streptomyces sp. NPDC021093 TaxID=3365112 RepID=UPI00378F9E57